MTLQATPDDERFRSLFDANFEGIRGYCLRRLPVSEANDAVAEVFTTAWRRIATVPPGEEERLWLFGVARNVVRNHERSRRRSSRLQARLGSLAPAVEPGPEVQIVVAAEHAAVTQALAALRPGDREVIRLRLWEELSVTEAATVLGINEKAAAKRYTRALKRLEARMAQPVDQRIGPHTTLQGGEQ